MCKYRNFKSIEGGLFFAGGGLFFAEGGHFLTNVYFCTPQNLELLIFVTHCTIFESENRF